MIFWIKCDLVSSCYHKIHSALNDSVFNRKSIGKGENISKNKKILKIFYFMSLNRISAVRRWMFLVRILNELLWHATCRTWFQYTITLECGKSSRIQDGSYKEKNNRFLKRLRNFLPPTMNATRHNEWIDPDRLEFYELSKFSHGSVFYDGPTVMYRFLWYNSGVRVLKTAQN